MKYSEIINLPDSERESVIQKLTNEDINDLIDQKLFSSKAFVEQANHIYFDTADDLYKYLLHNVVPASKPWRASEIAGHELAHAGCAIALGATSIRYSVIVSGERDSQISTHVHIPTPLPNLAFAAIAMHPYDSSLSTVDQQAIREYGYESREYVTERIQRWNGQHNEIFIPEPRQVPLILPRSLQ